MHSNTADTFVSIGKKLLADQTTGSTFIKFLQWLKDFKEIGLFILLAGVHYKKAADQACPVFYVADRNLISQTLLCCWQSRSTTCSLPQEHVCSCYVTHIINLLWCALRHFSPKQLVFSKGFGCTDVTQYLCQRTTAISEVWGQQLDQRSPPPAAGHKHRVTRRMKLIRKFLKHCLQ